MGLSFRQLEVLRAVARHGAVTAAASDLRVSQPAVSMMLRECAAAAGFPLFMRRQGRLQPTPELRVFLDDIERVFSGVERINRLIEDMRDASVGSVVVAVTPALADSLLPSAIAAFRRTRPRIQVTVQAMDVGPEPGPVATSVMNWLPPGRSTPFQTASPIVGAVGESTISTALV